MGYALSACGLWFQLKMGFRLPFPVNLLLLPVTVFEYVLVWLVHS